METKFAIITGASSGVGAAVAKRLAAKGYSLGLVVRNPEKGKEVMEAIIKATKNDNIRLFIADLSKQTDIRRVASEIGSFYPKIDVLINNAGLNPVECQLTADGFETAWAINHLAYFLLTDLLLDHIKQSGDGRIINTASMAEQFGKIYWNDINFEKEKFTAMKAYSQSKLANVMFTFKLAEKLKPDGIKVNAVHPGLVSSGFGKGGKTLLDKIMRFVAKNFGRKPEKAAETFIWLLTDPHGKRLTGTFVSDNKVIKNNPIADDVGNLSRLWMLSENHVQLK